MKSPTAPQKRADIASPITLSRRSALKLALGLGLLGTTMPRVAFADTQSDLNSAKSEAAQVQEELDKLAGEYEDLSREQAQTQEKVNQTQQQIDDTQAQIDEKQKAIDEQQQKIDEKQEELDEKREILAKRVRGDYKSGGVDLLGVLLNSASFDELLNNVYYMDKISENDADLIQQVSDAQNQLIAFQQKLKAEQEQLVLSKQNLENSKADLEQLNTTQKQQLSDMQQKQSEVSDMLAKLNSKVQSLIDKQNAELLAASQERARQDSSATVISNAGSGSQQRVVSRAYSVPSPGAGLCAMWVSQVFQAAGLGYPGGNACDMYANWCTTADRSQLQPGMIIAVSTHSHTTMGRIYGHVGIYVGSGIVRDNVGVVRTIGLDSWINTYGTTVTPKWGWVSGVKLA